LTILVRQFRNTCPRVSLDVATSRQQDTIEVMQCLCRVLEDIIEGQHGQMQALSYHAYLSTGTYSDVKIEISLQEITQRPAPFRTLEEKLE
jgi:hypothetical protein